MSASLKTEIVAPSHLDRLTCADPSADDLRYRANFWRKYVMTTSSDEVSHDQAMRILANCDAMDARAKRLDKPGRVVVLAPTVPARKPRAAAVAKPRAVTAEEFWRAHGAAVRAIGDRFGNRWYLQAAETVCATIPSKLRSYKSERGTLIKFRADHRLPAAQYWPGGVIPGELVYAPGRVAGAELVAADMLRRQNAAHAEQIERDRRLRREAAERLADERAAERWCDAEFPPMVCAKHEWRAYRQAAT